MSQKNTRNGFHMTDIKGLNPKMNQFNESGGDDQSEDGQWRSAEDDISHEEEGDTADSLDIKPPQANRTENRYKEKKSTKEKKHSRDRRHRERERNNDRERDERRHRHREREERYDNIAPRNNEREVIRYEQAYRESAAHYRQNYKDRGHEKIRDRDKEKNRDRRKESSEKSEKDKVLEELDLRSRLLRNRTKYESEKKPDERLPVDYENKDKRSEKEYFKYEYDNRRDKDADRNDHHYHHGEYYRDRKQMVELIDSPENYSENITIGHHKKEKDRRPITAEEKEHAARRAKLIEAEREMARRKELAREELEARREMRREREESRPESTATPPSENAKKRKTSMGDEDEKKKPKTAGDVVTVSDNSDDENDTESDSSSSRTEEEERVEYEGKENSDGELPSPLSIGELSKTDLRQKTRTRSRSPSRSRSNSEDTRSRSRSTSKSESPRSRSRSRSHSSRQQSKSNSPRYHRRNDDGEDDDPDMNDNRDSSPEGERKRKENEYKNYRHDGNVSDRDEDQLSIKSPEITEPKEELTPYFPAIQGCRSVEEFQCLNRIEEGTYGVVYRAKDKRTEEIVALKRLKMEKEKEGFPITSLREINTLLKGQHPNIVTVREIVVGSNMDKIFIVMDYVEHDLKSLMETMKHKKQVFLPGEVKCLTQQLLRAVAHLHDNWILHRDLKTSNLLLSHKGILKVGDFGLAREYGSPLKPYTSIVVTLWYRAPELLLCCKEYSIPIDMWSVGCIFAEFLAMAALFPGKSEVDQLNRIFKDLGTPNERIWPGYNELPAVQKMTFTEYPVSNLRKKFSHLTSELGLSLLQGLLTYDPKQRLSAEQALKNNYFKELPLPIDPAMFPTWPAKSELGSWKPSASPKPPSGGSEFKNLGADDGDQRWGATLMDSRQLAMGPGFSLKF